MIGDHSVCFHDLNSLMQKKKIFSGQNKIKKYILTRKWIKLNAAVRISSGYIVHVLVCYFNPFMSHGSFQFPFKMPYSATIYP